MGNEIIDNMTDIETQEENQLEETIIKEEYHAELEQPTRQRQKMKRSTKRMLFYWAFMIFPILQVCMMYIYVNIESFALAFRVYDFDESGFLTYKYSFESFNGSFTVLFGNMRLIRNSAINYLINLATGLGLGTLFSFYVYKEYPLAGFFKVMLFMPSLISGVILALIYKYMVTDIFQYIQTLLGVPTTGGLLATGSNTQYWGMVIYNVWVGFGSHVILITGTMSGINESLVEAAVLDGINSIKEFWYITLPMIWPTIITFTVTGMAAFFVNDMGAYSMFGINISDDTITTFGYKFFVDTRYGNLYRLPGGTRMTYSEISALGLVFTAITFIVMTTTKKLMEIFGPSVD